MWKCQYLPITAKSSHTVATGHTFTGHIFSSLELNHTFPVHLFDLLYVKETVDLNIYWSSAGNRTVLLLSKKCSFDMKSYVFSKKFSHKRKVSIKKQFFTGFDIKMFCRWVNNFYVSTYKKPFSDFYLFIFEHNFEKI